MTITPRLAAKVRAQNRANQLVREIAPAYLHELAKFVGQKIYKADGGFTKKFADAMPKGIAGDYFNPSNYNLSRVFRVSENVEGAGHCEYMQSTVYLGKLDGGILTELYPFNPENFPTDYKAESVIAAREELRLAQAAVSAAQGKLCVFGEYDR